MFETTYRKLFVGLTPNFDDQNNRWYKMIEKVKDIDGFYQLSIFKHDQLFQDMGHRAEW